MIKIAPLKILMFGWEFPPFNSGGLGVACLGLTKALVKQGIDITFILPKKFDIDVDYMNILYASQQKYKFFISDQMVTYTTPILFNKKPHFNTYPPVSLIEEVKRYGELAKNIVDQLDFDIIHAHDWLTFPAAIAAKELTGKPLITHIHATEYDRTGTIYGNRTVFEIEKLGMECADKVIPVSNYTKQLIIQNYNIPQHKISVIHNGVDLPCSENIQQELLELKKDNKIVIFVGRLTLQKGPDYFIKSAQMVLKFLPRTIFVMVGSGDMKEKLINESIALGISENIIFTGFLRDEKLKQIYQSADLFVMPSVSEPFGIAGLESALLGAPILISKQSGVSEVINHALKVDFWDINEMANKIVSVLSHQSLRKTLGANGSNETKSLTWEEAAKKMKQIYYDIS